LREGEEMRPKKYPYNKKLVKEQARRLVLNKKNAANSKVRN
jgi:hypothetical protein